MSAVDTKFYEKKKSSFFYGVVSFLSFVVFLTLGLFFYSSHIDGQNKEIQSQITGIKNSITEIQSDKNIQIYTLYSQHKGFIEKMAYSSQIPFFVSHLKKNFKKYGLEGEGFSYSAGNVSVELSGQTNDAGYAYEKVVKFLREYNLQDQKKMPFKLQKIQTFTGYDKITYTGEFTITSNF